MMKSFFLYLTISLQSNAGTAVTYHLSNTNSYAVCNCYYYNNYNPVKGYTLSYYQRACKSRFSQKSRVLFFKFLIGLKY
jgi:hypothetical protein